MLRSACTACGLTGLEGSAANLSSFDGAARKGWHQSDQEQCRSHRLSGLGQSAAFLPALLVSYRPLAQIFTQTPPQLSLERHGNRAEHLKRISQPVRASLRNATAAEPAAAPNTTTLINRRRARRRCKKKMIEVICNDRLGKKIRVKCNEDDTIGDLKKLVAAQSGTRPEKIRIQKWYTIFKDHITLEDYEIHDGMGLELYYN